MEKILIVLLSAICFLGISDKVSAADKIWVEVNPRFDMSQVPREVTVGTSGKFSTSLLGYIHPDGYELDIIPVFSVDDSSILAVSKDGEWQALKTGTVTVSCDYDFPKSNYEKYPDVEFIFPETAWEGVTIEVKPVDNTVSSTTVRTPAPKADPTPATTIPSTTAPTKTAPTTAPTGAVAKTNYKAKTNTSAFLAILFLSSLTILGLSVIKFVKTFRRI